MASVKVKVATLLGGGVVSSHLWVALSLIEPSVVFLATISNFHLRIEDDHLKGNVKSWGLGFRGSQAPKRVRLAVPRGQKLAIFVIHWLWFPIRDPIFGNFWAVLFSAVLFWLPRFGLGLAFGYALASSRPGSFHVTIEVMALSGHISIPVFGERGWWYGFARLCLKSFSKVTNKETLTRTTETERDNK